MTIRHTVKRGDSLWSLSHRYMGSGTKWRALWQYHNQEAAKSGRSKLLLPIKDPNLIYVGQYIMLPANPRNVPQGNGTRHEANRMAVPLNLKVTYTIGRNTPPMVYKTIGADFIVITEISGDIGIELLSDDRHGHHLELLMSKNPTEARFKLKQAYDPPLGALTAKPNVGFNSGTNKVSIKTPIAASAGLGPYTVGVHIESPLHLSGQLKPAPVESTVEVNNHLYKFRADLEYKVDVDLQPKPRGRGDEMIRVTKGQEEPIFVESDKNIDWQKITAMVEWTIIGIGLILLGYKATPTADGVTSIQPLLHVLNPDNPCNRRYFKNNA